jgi:ribosomal protein S18 acetylase RimI-like enzyme
MFESMTDADVPAIVALMNTAYRGTGAAVGWSTEAGYISRDRTTEALLRAEILATPEGTFLKWVDEGAIAGCVWLQPLGDGVWYLGSLVADPRRQDSGLGKLVWAAAERWVAARGGRRVRMSVVNVRDALIAWYVRRGYHVTGDLEPFPYGDDRFGVPLRDDLAFVILAKDLA